ncbi:MAG: lipase family protein [Pseudomonadota bacterium]
MSYRTCLAPAFVLTLLLSACGGGSGTGSGSGGTAGGTQGGGVVTTPPVPPPPVRGALVGNATVVPVAASGNTIATLPPNLFQLLLESAQPGTSTLTSTPVCSITNYTVRYNTLGGAGESTEASAAIMLPSGSDPACSGPRPVLLYAHGTSPLKNYDMADLRGTEARLIAAIFAAQGYIVVAPNYAGYAGSTLPYHAYLDAEQEANDMIDGLRAARLSFARIGAADSGKLYVTGYSQGGHVAVSTQRVMQARYASEFKITAAAGLSGPYALLKFGDAIFGGAPTSGTTVFLPLLINAAQHAGAGLYANSSEIYESRYASGIESLLPGTLTLGELADKKLLPSSALFAKDSLPQASGASAFFGDGNLIKTSYRNAYLNDVRDRPCDTSATDPLNCAPQQALRKWLQKNDLRNFTPASPLLLCGGDEDPIVPYYNTEAAAAYFKSKTGSAVQVLNVDDTPGLNDPYLNNKLGFLAAKAAVRINAATSGGSGGDAVRDAYHAGLVAPFCLRSAREFFRAH